MAYSFFIAMSLSFINDWLTSFGHIWLKYCQGIESVKVRQGCEAYTLIECLPNRRPRPGCLRKMILYIFIYIYILLMIHILRKQTQLGFPKDQMNWAQWVCTSRAWTLLYLWQTLVILNDTFSMPGTYGSRRFETDEIPRSDHGYNYSKDRIEFNFRIIMKHFHLFCSWLTCKLALYS